MTFLELAQEMYPCWIVGILIIFSVYFSKQRYTLRIKKSSIKEFTLFMIFVTIVRFFMYKTSTDSTNIPRTTDFLPLATPLTVFWEDAVHGLTLLLLNNLLKKNILNRLFYLFIMLLLMIEFSIGHLYQGLGSAIVISFYVPLSVYWGKKNGFGTVMICHMLYDAFTIFFIRFLTGL